jgi:N-acylneuraminate cytidylyltransferase/CMP-N,N'-diacetyllegionaminic acid synthase
MENLKNKKILAIIPARGGSKGVKNKNIRLLSDKPLICWIIDAARKSKYINKIIVSTDDTKIKDVCCNTGVQVIDRPKELAQDDSPTIDAILYTLEQLKLSDYMPDYVLLLQCTSPFTTDIEIDGAIEMFAENEDRTDSVISVIREEYPPYWLKRITGNGVIKDFLQYDKVKYNRRQDFETLYKLNGSIHIAKPENILKNRGFMSNNSIAFIMDNSKAIDIDTEEDLKYAEFIMKNK